MTKLLILTAGFGDGHNAAARNLSAACESLAGPGTSSVVDLFALAALRLNRIARPDASRAIAAHLLARAAAPAATIAA